MSRMTRGGHGPATSSSLLLLQQQRRGRGLPGGGGGGRQEGGDQGLDLFYMNRRSVSVAAGEEADVHNVNRGRISVGQARLMRSGMDDLLSAADMGKHDYDWLLTPPGSPLFSTLDARESQFPSAAPRSNLSARSTSTTKTSRFSVPQQETKQPTRPARSSSATRPSVTTYSSASQVSTTSSRTSILNTSTASITSSRPSTPGNRSSSSSSTRQSAPASSRPTPSRSSTPTRTRPAAPACPGDKTRPSHGSRPSTPTTRAHVPATSNSTPSSVTPAASRSSSRPSTPTRRAPAQPSAPAPARSPSVGRAAAASGRAYGLASRPNSPGPRVRPTPQPLVLPDFPLDAPPNLRTKVPERPVSAGRTRPGLPLTARSNSHAEAAPPGSSSRRQSVSPVVTRGRLPENSPKLRPQSNGHEPGPPEAPKPVLRESGVSRITIKTNAAAESTGFGRTISKKALDMALWHMDIRHGMGGVRGASLFPQSIRSAAAKVVPARMSDLRAPVSGYGVDPAEGHGYNGTIHAGCNGATYGNGDMDLIGSHYHPEIIPVGRAGEPDACESSRYDAILLREDARNLNWLHSVEGKLDQSPVFDLRYDTLPEPFVLL